MHTQKKIVQGQIKLTYKEEFKMKECVTEASKSESKSLAFSKDYEFGKLKFNIISFTTYFVLIRSRQIHRYFRS